MDGLILRYVLVKLIGVFNRAVLDTGSATRAFLLDNVPGLLKQGYREVSLFPFYTVNFRIRQDLYVGMPADLDQFGREYSHGTVIGGEGLVKLGHMAANGRRLVNQINLKTRGAEIKGGLNAADPATDNHDIAKITVRQILANLFYNLFFHFFHSLCPHNVLRFTC